MKTFKQHVQDQTFTEYTVTIDWAWSDGEDIYTDGTADVMVHATTDGTILRAYTYMNDAKGMPKEWIGKRSKNPLFIYLSKNFINEYRQEIEDQISDEMREKTHENV